MWPKHRAMGRFRTPSSWKAPPSAWVLRLVWLSRLAVCLRSPVPVLVASSQPMAVALFATGTLLAIAADGQEVWVRYEGMADLLATLMLDLPPSTGPSRCIRNISYEWEGTTTPMAHASLAPLALRRGGARAVWHSHQPALGAHQAVGAHHQGTVPLLFRVLAPRAWL